MVKRGLFFGWLVDTKGVAIFDQRSTYKVLWTGWIFAFKAEGRAITAPGTFAPGVANLAQAIVEAVVHAKAAFSDRCAHPHRHVVAELVHGGDCATGGAGRTVMNVLAAIRALAADLADRV